MCVCVCVCKCVCSSNATLQLRKMKKYQNKRQSFKNTFYFDTNDKNQYNVHTCNKINIKCQYMYKYTSMYRNCTF